MVRIVGIGSDVLSVLLTVYVIYTVFYPLPPLQERAIVALLLMFIFFLQEKRERTAWVRVVCNVILSICGAIVFGYIALFHETVEARIGIPTQIEQIFGIVAILLVLEATRRALGYALVAFIMVFFLYGILGEYVPVSLGGHSGFGMDRIVNTLYLTTNGLFGIVLYVMYKYVFLFVLFGRVLERTGALHFIMDFARGLVGHIKGGPAMIAVVSSGFVGSISGSAVANVTITGSVSIPMMKSLGFKPHIAGAVEAAASTGGQFMPPVMGAAAFLVMQYLGIGYLEVMRAAVLPAVVYFISMLVSVYVYAHRSGLVGLPKNELPQLTKVLLRLNAITFIGGLGSLLILLLLQYSPIYASLWAIAVMIAISFMGKDRITFSKARTILSTTSLSFLEIGIAGLGVGIIVGIIILSGLATRFSALIIGLAGGSFALTLILTMVVSIILGTGLPTTVTYILLAILVAPALVKMGVIPIAAHMFIFFMGMMSMVTPPVALAAYAGASLAGASMWRTGVTACMLSLPAYILPYIFVIDNSLMLMGSWVNILWAAMRSVLGCSLLSYVIVGSLKNRREIPKRIIMGACAVFLITPEYWADGIALLLITVCFLPYLRRIFPKIRLH